MTTMRLSKPQRDLLEEIRENGTLYITEGSRFDRTVRALERRGLVVRSEPDYSPHRQHGWSVARLS